MRSSDCVRHDSCTENWSFVHGCLTVCGCSSTQLAQPLFHACCRQRSWSCGSNLLSLLRAAVTAGSSAMPAAADCWLCAVSVEVAGCSDPKGGQSRSLLANSQLWALLENAATSSRSCLSPRRLAGTPCVGTFLRFLC